MLLTPRHVQAIVRKLQQMSKSRNVYEGLDYSEGPVQDVISIPGLCT